MKLRLSVMLLLALPVPAVAAIYKAVDAEGHVIYSSTPIKGGKRIILDPPPVSAQKRAQPAPRSVSRADFPVVDAQTQQGRDMARRQILQDELASEQKLLQEARTSLVTARERPLMYRGEDGSLRADADGQRKRLQGLESQLESHQQNIDAIRSELSRL